MTDRLVFLLDDYFHGKILDLGGSNGHFWYDENNNHGLDRDITIADNDDESLKIARAYCFKTIKLDANKSFCLNDRMYDVVLAGHIIEHLESPYKFLLEIRRVMKRTGVLIITVPNNNYILRFLNDPSKFKEHLYSFNDQGMRQLLEAAGFKIIYQYGMTPFFDIPFFKKRWIELTYVCVIK